MKKYALDRIGIGTPDVTPEDIDNLARLEKFHAAGRAQWDGEALIGPQYERLFKQGFIRRLPPDIKLGTLIEITETGIAALREHGRAA